ncbi:hypothetical protein B0H12DRAFT_1140849 [Mycena haematopus]|nr:hypothetical protein B0H12DRAFT_1140848 [Mycena haematopus]KAJ7236085.1 hypothetical protein B0H12DRAFT_1140849 [Mycena haematopus]
MWHMRHNKGGETSAHPVDDEQTGGEQTGGEQERVRGGRQVVVDKGVNLQIDDGHCRTR